MTLGEAIREARGHRTREEFAGVVGCSYFTLRRWELDGGRPQSNSFVRILAAEGVPLDLLGGEKVPRLPQGVTA